MAKYKLQSIDDSSGVLYTESGMHIPNSVGNRHWYEYEQWKLGLDVEGNNLSGNPGPQVPDPQYTLAELKGVKKDELKHACQVDIESGFTSNATGTSYTYEYTQKDQTNIAVVAQTNVTLDFTVIDSNGDKQRISHTSVQMNQVFTDGVTQMQQKQSTLYVLYNQVDLAADESAVNAIIYS